MARACVHASVISHVAAAAATFVSSRLSLFYISAFGQSGRGHGAEEAAPWATTIWIGGIYMQCLDPTLSLRRDSKITQIMTFWHKIDKKRDTNLDIDSALGAYMTT